MTRGRWFTTLRLNNHWLKCTALQASRLDQEGWAKATQTRSSDGDFGNWLWLKKKSAPLPPQVGWSFCPFLFCDESIWDTSIIFKTLQIHRAADSPILAFTGCTRRSSHCPHSTAQPRNTRAVQASFSDVIGNIISQAGVTDTAGTTLPFHDGCVFTAQTRAG